MEVGPARSGGRLGKGLGSLEGPRRYSVLACLTVVSYPAYFLGAPVHTKHGVDVSGTKNNIKADH